MASTINADVTNGLVLTPDTSGEINLQAGGVTKMSVTSSGVDGTNLTNIPAANLTGSLPAGMGGKILQFVYNNTDTRATYSAPNTNVPTRVTPLDTTITPTSASSKIFITFSMHCEGQNDVLFRLYRDGTEIGRNSASTSRWSGFASMDYDTDHASTPSRIHFTYVDEPNTTSAVTYNVRVQSSNANNYSFSLNRCLGGAATGQDTYELGTSNVTLMEVGA